MRDCVFRGIDIKTGRWVYGGYYCHQIRTICPIGDYLSDKDFEHLIFSSGFSDWNMPKPLITYKVYKDTVGQFTGVKDKNGINVFEGDIIKYDNKIVRSITRAVEFKNGSFGIEGFVKGTHIAFANILKSEFEVIGNLHDNEDLKGNLGGFSV